MRSTGLQTIGIINAAVQTVVRVASPWMGVLWMTALPLRLLQAYFVYQLSFLQEPQYYFYYLWKLAAMVFAAFILSLYGRAVFVRACYIASDSARDSKLEPLKVPLSDLIPYVYSALMLELFFYLALFTVVGALPFVLLGGVIAAASYGVGGPKLIQAIVAPYKLLFSWRSIVALLGLAAQFAAGLSIALINLYFLIYAVVELVGPLLGSALPRWETILKFHLVLGVFPLYPEQWLVRTLLLVGASIIIEPFWLAANVDLVQKLRARKSGEDLRLWFGDVKSEGAA